MVQMVEIGACSSGGSRSGLPATSDTSQICKTVSDIFFTIADPIASLFSAIILSMANAAATWVTLGQPSLWNVKLETRS